MISSDLSDPINFQKSDPHSEKRRKWHTKNAGRLDLRHRAGEKTIFSEEKVYRQAKTPQWLLDKRKRTKNRRKKARKEKNAAIYHRQQAYRRAKQQYAQGAASGNDEIANLTWLQFNSVATSTEDGSGSNLSPNGNTENSDANTSINKLLKLTSDEYTAAEIARKAGHSNIAKGSAEKLWEAEIDTGALEEGAVERAAGELTDKTPCKIREEVGDGTFIEEGDPDGLNAALPELFHGFVHSKSISKFRSKEEVEEDKLKRKEEAERRKRIELSRLESQKTLSTKLPVIESQGEKLEQGDQITRVFREEKTESELMRIKEAEAARRAEENHVKRVQREKELLIDEARQRKAEQKEVEEERNTAKRSTTITGGLTVLSFTEQRTLRRKRNLQRSGGRGVTTFDLSLPGKMRVLKPDDYQVRYLSHCTVQQSGQDCAYCYHPKYTPPRQCCLGGGEVRHNYDMVPMLIKYADPTHFENNTWGKWSVPKCTIIQSFVSRDEALEFARVNKILNVFPTEEGRMAKAKEEREDVVTVPKGNKSKLRRGRRTSSDGGKLLDEKAKKKAARKAAKKRAKQEAAAKAAKDAEAIAALEARKEKLRLKEIEALKMNIASPPKQHALGLETKRLWAEDECVVLLHNGRLLSCVRSNVSCIPAGAFDEVKGLEDFFMVQIGFSNGEWFALDRDGRSHKVVVERRGIPRITRQKSPLKEPWLKRKQEERRLEEERLAAIEAARLAAIEEEKRLAREAEEAAKKAKEDALWG